MIRIAAVIVSVALVHGVKLEAKAPVAGDRVEIQVETVVDLDLSVKDSGGTETVRTSSQLRTEKFSHSVTEASATSATFKVTCSNSTVQRSGTNAAITTEKTELDGKTYWVVRGAGAAIKNEDGTLATTAASNLGSWEDFGRLLPKDPVDVGSTWAIEAADVGALLNVGGLTDAKSTVTGKLDALDGDKATLSFSGSISGKTGDGYDLKVVLEECKMLFDKAAGRPGSFSLKGAFEASKKLMEGYVAPGQHKPKEEQIGEARLKSKKFEVTVTYR